MSKTATSWLSFRLQLLICALICLLALTGCNATNKIPGVGQLDVPWGKKGRPTTGNTTKKPVVRTKAIPPTKWVRQSNSAARLFSRRTISGHDLLLELKALRSAAASGNLDRSLTALFGKPSVVQSGDNAFVQQIKGTLAGIFSRELGVIAFKSTTGFFNRIEGSKNLLKQQRITLPDASKMNRTRRQQVLIMAAMVIGFKISNSLIESGNKELATLEKRYQELLKRRNEAASLLLKVLIEKERAQKSRAEAIARDLKAALGPDVALLDKIDAGVDLETFALDLGRQNLALRYLRRKNPGAFKKYRVDANRFVSQYASLLKSATGATAFAAFGVGFYKKATQLVEQSGLLGAALTLPFGKEVLTESGRLGGNLQKSIVSTRSVISRLFYGDFNVYADGAQIAKSTTVADAVSQFEEKKAHLALRSKVVQSRGRGLLNRLYACEPSLVGDYFDRVVPAETRTKFAEKYFGLKSGASEFYFRNAFDGMVRSRNRKTMVRDLLRRGPPKGGGEISQLLNDIHRAATSKLGDMKSAEFMRLIYASDRSRPHRARLTAGSVSVGIVPSRDSIFAYERYVSGCMRRYVKR